MEDSATPAFIIHGYTMVRGSYDARRSADLRSSLNLWWRWFTLDYATTKVMLAGLGTDFIMALVTLWAASEILAVKKRFVRLVAGAFVAAVFFVGALILVGLGWTELVSLPTIAISLISIPVSVVVSFYPIRPDEILRLSGLVAFFTLLAAGTMMAVGIFTGGFVTGSGWDLLTAFIIAVGVILIVAEMGWGVVHTRVRRALFYVPILIHLSGTEVETRALVDTGNELRDPLTGVPVVVVEYSVIRSALPAELREVLDEGDDPLHYYEKLSRLEAFPSFASRVRLIPFTSIGKEKGMLLGIRPDGVELLEGGTRLCVKDVILGVHLRALSASGDYRALLHPELLWSV